MGEDVVDRVDESHVEHLVGFVEDDGVHVGELDDMTVDEVDESSRRGDYYLNAALEGAYLALDAGTAVDRQHFKLGNVFGKVGEVAGDLEAEFAGGGQDEGLGNMAVDVDALYDGEAKRGSLTRAGLCQGNEVVVAVEQHRDNFFLYGHRGFKAHFGYAFEEILTDS